MLTSALGALPTELLTTTLYVNVPTVAASTAAVSAYVDVVAIVPVLGTLDHAYDGCPVPRVVHDTDNCGSTVAPTATEPNEVNALQPAGAVGAGGMTMPLVSVTLDAGVVQVIVRSAFCTHVVVVVAEPVNAVCADTVTACVKHVNTANTVAIRLTIVILKILVSICFARIPNYSAGTD